MALAQITDSPSLGEVQRPSTLSRFASQHAAILLLALVLLILPAVASDFIFVQVVGWAMILGIIALSLMFLAGYGGMVSLAQMTVAGVSGYMVTVFGASSLPTISLFWPWWVRPDCYCHRRGFRHVDRRALVADRGHLHDHDHARDCGGVLLSDPAELADLQRLCRFHHHPRAHRLRH